MLNYTVGSENTDNGVICYYGEEEAIGGYPKRKFEEESEEGFEKGPRKKRYMLGQNVGKWTDEEHNRFVMALKKFGRNWTLVQQEVKTRTLVQIRSHAQKYFLKKVRGIAPSTLTMDSKLISTASDGIVPTWLLQDDANYANKTSINTSSSINQSNVGMHAGGVGGSATGSRALANVNLYMYDEASNPELSIIDEQANLVNACSSSSGVPSSSGNNSSSSSSNNNTTSSSGSSSSICDSGSIHDGMSGMTGGGSPVMDSSNMVMTGNMNMLATPIMEPSGGLSPDIRYSGYMGGGLLVDDQRDLCGYHDYRTNLMDVKSEMTPKFDYSPQGSGTISKHIINDCIFDEPYSGKRVSVDSTSLVSTAVSSPASIGPEKNYVPVSPMGLDMILMPPTVDINQGESTNPQQHFARDFHVASGRASQGSPQGTASSSSVGAGCDSNSSLRGGAGVIPDLGSYLFSCSFEDNENVINPSISLSNCDVPWPLTGSDQFFHPNDSDNMISSSSPSASSSISYLDMDSSGEARQYSPGTPPSQNKHYDIGSTLSDFVYCGDSLGVDLLNVYTNLRGDSSSPIIDNADVTDFI
ncbi:Myb domain-containing protein [Cryptosporidium canis]|uniref:Myb domain-containing protein n=1 Tax=Cryptosporidium canis TaxID=195482 RepID=A0ABQ8P6E1_9CRYT|nr:Myb domain-containing protein [Cryptosporidium canis]